jgi:hypothetical protein
MSATPVFLNALSLVVQGFFILRVPFHSHIGGRSPNVLILNYQMVSSIGFTPNNCIESTVFNRASAALPSK